MGDLDEDAVVIVVDGGGVAAVVAALARTRRRTGTCPLFESPCFWNLQL